jgi:excisionase family DNA binding protein
MPTNSIREDTMATERLTMSVEEAGERLGISRSLAYELVRRGEVPCLRLGRRLVVPVKGLDAMIERATVDNGA